MKFCEKQTAGGHCGKPSEFYYNALGGGVMWLCEEHAQPHLAYVKPIAAIESERLKQAQERILKQYEPVFRSLAAH